MSAEGQGLSIQPLRGTVAIPCRGIGCEPRTTLLRVCRGSRAAAFADIVLAQSGPPRNPGAPASARTIRFAGTAASTMDRISLTALGSLLLEHRKARLKTHWGKSSGARPRKAGPRCPRSPKARQHLLTLQTNAPSYLIPLQPAKGGIPQDETPSGLPYRRSASTRTARMRLLGSSPKAKGWNVWPNDWRHSATLTGLHLHPRCRGYDLPAKSGF
jgi:hypothetical protein